MTKTEPRSAGSGGGRDKTTPTELLALADTLDYGLKLLNHQQLCTRVERISAELRTLATTLSAREDGWHSGAPNHPWDKEWFIAVTTYGDRVVLRALPEEYSYDFTTADSTYLMRDKIAKWTQFPDSNFVPAPKAPTAGEGK